MAHNLSSNGSVNNDTKWHNFPRQHLYFSSPLSLSESRRNFELLHDTQCQQHPLSLLRSKWVCSAANLAYE